MPKDADYLTKLVGDYLDRSVYIIHRLDAKTSGLILLGLSKNAVTKFQQLFEERDIIKNYTAIVKGIPDEGKIDREVVIKHKKKRKKAITVYTTLQSKPFKIDSEEFEGLHLSEVRFKPITGRWHQIRQHCAAMRNGIIGDVQHGNWTLNKLIPDAYEKRMYLHAKSLKFTHPFTQEELLIDTRVPLSFYRLLNSMPNS